MQGRTRAGVVVVAAVWALAAVCGALTPVEQQVEELYTLLRGQRVGMITNPTSITEDFTFLPDKFALDPAVPFKLVAFFAPEHGLRGDQQAGTTVADYTDELTQRTVYSLYGKHLAPSKEQLDLVDAILFDIQDVGARFYTFVWTMTHAMEACARYNKTFVVLDRPNPIGAEAVEGPPNALNANLIGRKWPNAKWGLPTRHGMTVGGLLYISLHCIALHCTYTLDCTHITGETCGTEIARLVDSEWMEPKLGDRLHVVKVPGYKRAMPWTALNRPWVMPSPNMPTFDGTALVYPGTGIFENVGGVTEGRGTTRPFELLGTPAADARTADLVVRTLNARNLPGCHFRTTFFTPTFSTFTNKLCGGLQIRLQPFFPCCSCRCWWTTCHHIFPFHRRDRPQGVQARADKPGGAQGVCDDPSQQRHGEPRNKPRVWHRRSRQERLHTLVSLVVSLSLSSMMLIACAAQIYTMSPLQIESQWQKNLTEFMGLRLKYLLYN